MGIDARMDVTSITMFGTISRGPDSRRETTTMLLGGANLQHAIQRHIAEHNGHALVLRRALQAEGRGIHAWTIDDLSVHVALVPMNGNPDTEEPRYAAVLSDNSDQLQTCIRLLLHERSRQRSDGPNSPPAPQAKPSHRLGPLKVPEGSVVYARAKDLDDAHPALSSDFLAAADSLVAHLGYRTEGDSTVVFGGLEVSGDRAEDGQMMAQSLHKIVDFWAGHTAKLAEQQPAMLEMLALVRACQISFSGPRVQIAMERTLIEPSSGQPDRPQGSPISPRGTHNPDIKDR